VATELPLRRYVLARRVERAKHLLQVGGDFALMEVAARAGFSDRRA
jgi:AraC-like DNA-binding protein